MSPATRVTCNPGVESTPDQVTQSRLYRDWYGGFRPGWAIEEVEVQAVRLWKGSLYMIFMVATATDPLGQSQSVPVLLRGHTVDILALVTDGPSEYVVLVEQPRVPAGAMVLANPSGTVDEAEQSISSAALRELAEEVGDDIAWSQPEWLGPRVVGSDEPFLVTPGGSDEDAAFCVVRAPLPTEQLLALRNRSAGLADEGEYIKLHVVKLTEALAYLASRGRPDLKATTSILMYLYSTSR